MTIKRCEFCRGEIPLERSRFRGRGHATRYCSDSCCTQGTRLARQGCDLSVVVDMRVSSDLLLSHYYPLYPFPTHNDLGKLEMRLSRAAKVRVRVIASDNQPPVPKILASSPTLEAQISRAWESEFKMLRAD